MTRFICVSSGKGGVGKTTTAVNLASAMNSLGKDIILVEGNLSTPHIHMHLGDDSVRKNLHDAVNEKIHVSELIHDHHTGLKVIPAVTEMDHLKYPDYEGLKYSLMDLKGFSDYVLVDGAPGFGREALVPMEVADDIIVVTTPEKTALQDAKRTLEVASEIRKTVPGVVLNMVRKDAHEHTLEEVEKFLGVPVIASIPHDTRIRSALNKNSPVVHLHPKSRISKEYLGLGSKLALNR